MANDNLKIFGKEYTNVTGIKATSSDDDTVLIYTRGGGGSVVISDTTDSHGGIIKTITTTGETTTLQSKTVYNDGTTQTITADNGYDGLSEVVLLGRDDLTEPKDVDFIDYDGRLLYSYTTQEFLALTELPPNPTNPGLIAQGWNWTLEDAKDFVGNYGALVIGQSYITDDGKTRAYIHMSQDLVDISAKIYIYIYTVTAGAVTVSWGDGSTSSFNSTSTGSRNVNHTYSAAGDYLIEIEVLGGTHELGYHGSHSGVFSNANSNTSEGKTSETVLKVEIGSGFISFGRQPFRRCINLQSVTIPKNIEGYAEPTVASDGAGFDSAVMKGIVFPSGFQGKSAGNMFGMMVTMKYISVPKSTTQFSINTTAYSLHKLTFYSLNNINTPIIKLNYAKMLTHLIMPGNYTTINSNLVNGSMVKTVTIPSTVTTIQTEAFMYNYFLNIHCLPTVPPTLNNTRGINGIGPNSKIYVPYSEDHSILEAYQTATNWSTFASYMQEEPQS